MQLELIYYLILFVYVSLWSCQMVACQSTHSLIILTDSYINIFRILDILLGIVHLRTQRKLVASDSRAEEEASAMDPKLARDGKTLGSGLLAGRLFHCACTYNFKRLPLLGSFVNGLFLAALLMSAAIEGIQTCFHSEHSGARDKQSLLLLHRYTYPLTLIGFAGVGLVMQYCSLKAHELREEELCSESLLDLRSDDRRERPETNVVVLSQLLPGELAASAGLGDPAPLASNRSRSKKYDLRGSGALPTSDLAAGADGGRQLADDRRTISLKSLRMATNLETLQDSQLPLQTSTSSLASVSRDLELASAATRSTSSGAKSGFASLLSDRWALIRFFASPVALTLCATIVLIGRNDLVTEIGDAFLAVLVVCLIFTASYPPMKRAGKVLLQTAPDGVELPALETDLKLVDQSVLEVQELKVWSLTPRSNRVATCRLVLDAKRVHSDGQIKRILDEARARFLRQNIKNTTIEPVLK